MSTIKIAVACHKPAELPNNNLFMPVQVGAKNAAKRLEGLDYDDSGDNISDKNSSYCELTAQYWEWKNVKADYYGLCHYRRFLCFKNVKAKRDLRNQIVASIASAESFSRYGLDDEDGMRKIIEGNDVVIGEEQYVPRLYTPHGNQRTAYEHWVAHDRALIMKKDLDLMLKILSDVNKEVGAAAKEYLNSKNFLGFNCFVLKKPLFDELCEIEFETLRRLEEKVDISDYCQQLSRIYGFMGEIISSSYFYYLQQSGKYKIKRVPLVYFSYTDPIDLAPLKEKKAVPVIFNAADIRPEYFMVEWKSFVENVDTNKKYDVHVIIDGRCTFRNKITEMAKSKPVSVRFVDADAYRAYYKELYGLKDDNDGKNLEDISNHFSLLPFIPYIFHKYDKAIVVGENNIFCDDIASMWEEAKKKESAIYAPKDLFMISLANDIYVETAEIRLKGQIKNHLHVFSTNILVWDLKNGRESVPEKDVAKKYVDVDKVEKRKLLSKGELMNMLYENNFSFAPQEYCTLYESNIPFQRQLPYAPLADFQGLLAVRKQPKVINYLSNDPWEDGLYSETYDMFWKIAYTTGFQEMYRKRGIDLAIYRTKHDNRSLLVKLFPPDGSMRGKMTKILPPGTKRNEMTKRLLSVLRFR